MPLSTSVVRPAALCSGETAEKLKLEGNEETELTGVEQREDGMSDEERERSEKNWHRPTGV